jgi:hypothetical protein
LRISEKLDIVKVSAPSRIPNLGMDTVEGSTPSKTEKRRLQAEEELVM